MNIDIFFIQIDYTTRKNHAVLSGFMAIPLSIIFNCLVRRRLSCLECQWFHDMAAAKFPSRMSVGSVFASSLRHFVHSLRIVVQGNPEYTEIE